MSTLRTFTIDGMTCGHCVAAITKELTRLDGVTGVDVDLGAGRVAVRSDHHLDDADVAAAIDEAGYTISA